MYKAGSFYFPTGGGAFSVNLGFEPQGVAFFGGNQDAEDVSVVGGTPGVFFGMMWRDYLTNNVDYQSQANTTHGVRWQSAPITCLSVGSTVDYEAATGSLDALGFTINVTTPAPGFRLIHYLAWGEFEGAHGASLGATSPTTFDLALPYRPFTGLMFQMFASGASRDSSNASSNYFSMGVGNFPEDEDLTDTINNNAMGITFRTQTSMGQIGYTQHTTNFFDTGITQSVHSGVAGTFLTDIDHFEPAPPHNVNGARVRLFGVHSRASIAFWTGEGSSHNCNLPNFGNTAVITARENVQEIEAALFFGPNGYGEEQQLTPHVAYHYGVLTEDYQGCVAFDTGVGGSPATGTPSFFQSKQYCVADDIRSGGLRVASGELQGEDLVLTGEFSSNPGLGSSLVQLYGPEVDHQQFFRIIQ